MQNNSWEEFSPIGPPIQEITVGSEILGLNKADDGMSLVNNRYLPTLMGDVSPRGREEVGRDCLHPQESRGDSCFQSENGN